MYLVVNDSEHRFFLLIGTFKFSCHEISIIPHLQFNSLLIIISLLIFGCIQEFDFITKEDKNSDSVMDVYCFKRKRLKLKLKST